MHRPLATLLLAAAGVFSNAKASTLTGRAVEPTATGQIGVNPPNDLGDASHYIGWIGVDTQYLSLDGTKTKWIGVNSDYITKVPTTVTVNDKPVVSTVPLEIVASTATAKASGVAAGDVTILLSDKFRAALQEEVKNAAQSCGAGAKRQKRQGEFMKCMIRAGQGAAESGDGALELVSPGTWDRFGIEIAKDGPKELVELLQWGGDRVAKNKLRLFMGAVVAAGVGIGINAAAAEVPNKLKFNNGNLGDPDPTTTSSKCDPEATPNADSPVCTNKECVGKKRKCTKGKYKDCRCTGWTQSSFGGSYDKEVGDKQQKKLAEIIKDLPYEDSVPPKCSVNSNGDGFDGKPMAEPSAWCVCTSARKTGVYSTMTSEKSPCALKSMPTETISISTRAKYTGPVTSCKWTTPTFSSTTIDPFCTCNDNKMHGSPVETTTVEDKKTKTICVAPETEVPSRPTPEKAVKCKPKEVSSDFDGENCTGCNDARPFSDSPAYKAAAREFCRGNYDFEASQGQRPPQRWSSTRDIFTDSVQKDPDTGLPPICNVFNEMGLENMVPDSQKRCLAKGSHGANSEFRLTVRPAEDQSDCKPLKDYKLPTGDKCEEKFNSIIDTCIPGKEDNETGGYYAESNDNGCWEWWIWSKRGNLNLPE